MSLPKSESYDPDFLKANMMGPNAMKILEELAGSLELHEGMRVLDLGCGRGLTSVFLAKEFGVTVFATDLWIAATENHERFRQMGLDGRIVPIHAEAHELPYADEFFDAAVSIDAYHYFGIEDDYLDKHLAPLVKKGGQVAIAVPGLKYEFGDEIPEEMKPFWVEEVKTTIHSLKWWSDLWSRSNAIEVRKCEEMACCAEAWRDWLGCDNEYARHDIKMMEAEGGRYFNLVGIVAVKK